MTPVDEQRLDRLERAVRDLTRLGVRLQLVTDRFETPGTADSIAPIHSDPQSSSPFLVDPCGTLVESPVNTGVSGSDDDGGTKRVRAQSI